MSEKIKCNANPRHTTHYALLVCLLLLACASLALGSPPAPSVIYYQYDSQYQVERANYQTEGKAGLRV